MVQLQHCIDKWVEEKEGENLVWKLIDVFSHTLVHKTELLRIPSGRDLRKHLVQTPCFIDEKIEAQNHEAREKSITFESME